MGALRSDLIFTGQIADAEELEMGMAAPLVGIYLELAAARTRAELRLLDLFIHGRVIGGNHRDS